LSTRFTRLAGAALGVTRVALGVGMLSRPLLLPRLLGVDRVTAERMTWLVRMLGARDLALGVGAVSGRVAPDPRSWIVAGACCDAADAVALAAAVHRGRIHPVLGSAAAVSAAGAAVLAGSAVSAPVSARPSL
jgi:peptide-methionine (R)-S-oxide reductase